jgi:hypothetical protein
MLACEMGKSNAPENIERVARDFYSIARDF